jgi:hypothetical protein
MFARTKKSSTAVHKYKSHRNKVNNMIKHAREQFFLSANELVDTLQRNDSKSYWSLIRKLMKRTSQNYSIPPSSPQALPIFNVCEISLTSCSVIYIY